MKSKEELNALKEEIETVNKKLAELTEDELGQVTGGEAMAGFERMFDDLDVEKTYTEPRTIKTQLGELKWYDE